MASNSKDNSIKKPKLILKCSRITKQIKSQLTIVRDCNFSLYKGELLVVLAPAGNGKSTFAKMICGLIAPTSGEITIKGIVAGRKTNPYVSYQPEIPFVKSETTISELMNMYSRFFKDFNFKRAFKILKQFRISPKTKFEDLSITAIQIVETVLVSCRKTSLYVFDDPLIHTDPKYRSALIEIIKSCKKIGAVIIFSQVTHGLSNAADKAIFLKNDGNYILANINVEDNINLTAMYKEVFRNA